MHIRRVIYLIFLLAYVALTASSVMAHEVYVLDKATFDIGAAVETSTKAFASLNTANNVWLLAYGFIGLMLVYGCSVLLARTQLFRIYGLRLANLNKYAPLLLRIFFGVALVISTAAGSFLGPELPFMNVLGEWARWLFMILGIAITLGIFTEYAAALVLVLFVTAFFYQGPYMLTYFAYVGEAIVLLMYGVGEYSFDAHWRRRRVSMSNFEQEAFIVRICYGIALAYTAVTVKLTHPDITAAVVTKYNLTQYHWLFLSSDPYFITLIAGLLELFIALCIIFGFRLRLTVGISLLIYTISLFFFGEVVWPHLIFFGLSFYLLMMPQKLTLDRVLTR